MKKNIICCLLFCCAAIVSQAQTHHAKMVTNYGTMVVELYDNTPLHRDNFIKLVNEHFYDSLLFHRVIKGFMIQAGDPESKHANDTAFLGNGDLGYAIPAEFNENNFHKKGALAQARDENPDKASSACQFYIVQGQLANDSTFIRAKLRNNYEQPEAHKNVYRTWGGVPHLDMNYTVYGEVTKGFQVIDKIALVETDKNDRPRKPVMIISIRMLD
jgi:peptidyl-prolyl cis-trans isomerase B (cyclophilin B)